MSRLTSVTRQELINRLRRLGFSEPYSGGKYPYYMVRGMQRLTIPNTHASEIGVDLLSRVLKQAGISREDWIATNESVEQYAS